MSGLLRTLPFLYLKSCVGLPVMLILFDLVVAPSHCWLSREVRHKKHRRENAEILSMSSQGDAATSKKMNKHLKLPSMKIDV